MATKSKHIPGGEKTDLSIVQLKAVYSIFKGNSIQETAEAIGKHRQTVSFWLHNVPEFKEKIAELLAEEAEEVRFFLASTRGRMLRNLIRLSVEGSEATQLRATQLYLEKFFPPDDGMALRTPEEEATIRRVLALREESDDVEDEP